MKPQRYYSEVMAEGAAPKSNKERVLDLHWGKSALYLVYSLQKPHDREIQEKSEVLL